MIKVIPIWDSRTWMRLQDDFGFPVVSTVSKARGWQRGLSPFVLGPCTLWKGQTSKNMENAWQYSKVYGHVNFTDKYGWPNQGWWAWAKAGWANPRAVRYPMGKGKKPLYSLYIDSKGFYNQLDYVKARKMIYGPLYRDAVKDTPAYRQLENIYRSEGKLILLDYDAYDHEKWGMTLTDVLHEKRRKMGHAFVLSMMLQNDPALKLFGRL